MGEASCADGTAASAFSALDVAALEAPIVLCTRSGRVKAATTAALALLRRAGAIGEPPEAMPGELWRLLDETPAGEAVEWRPPRGGNEVLGCTRYTAAHSDFVLLMRDLSSKHRALSRRWTRQQGAYVERVVASVAQELRGSVASVVYGADFLNVTGTDITPDMLEATVRDISRASARLQETVDALLDYARLGPRITLKVSLRDVLNRALGSLRRQRGDTAHLVRVDLAPHMEWVRGNPIALEQILLNLLLNAVEAADTPRCVIVTAFPSLRPPTVNAEHGRYVCLRVWDDGPGIAREIRGSVFEPFFTTKPGNIGLGLAFARDAAEAMDGALELTDDESGTCFSLYVPEYVCESEEP